MVLPNFICKSSDFLLLCKLYGDWSFFFLPFRIISKSAVDITLEDKTKELMEESRMLLVQFAIDRVSLGVHSMGEVLLLYLKDRRWEAELCSFHQLNKFN